MKGARYNLKQAVAATLVIGLLGLLLVCPWLARNYAWTGNPVYPFFNQDLGLTETYQLDAQRFIRNHAPDYSGWQAGLELLLRKIHLLPLNSGTLLINLALVLLPILALIRFAKPAERGPGGRRFLYLFLGVFFSFVYLCWAFGTGNLDGRFMMPAYFALCLLLAAGYLHVAEWFASLSSSKRIAFGLPLALTLLLLAGYLYHVWNFYSDLGESPWPALSRQSEERGLRQRFKELDLIRYINEQLPPDSLILGIGYPVRRPYVSHVKHGRHPIRNRLGKKDYSAEELRTALRQEGFTHLVTPGLVSIPDTAAERLEPAGFEPVFQGDRSVLYAVPSE